MWFKILPGEKFVAITPHDTNLLSAPVRGLYVGVAGDVKIKDMSGTDVTFTNLEAGIIHPICATQVYATGTAATNIVGVLEQ